MATWVLWAERGDHEELFWVDRETGLLATPTDRVLEAERVPFDPPLGWFSEAWVPAEVAAARLRLYAANGASSLRVWVDGRIGCVQEDELLLGIGDEVWGVVASGRAVSWHGWE